MFYYLKILRMKVKELIKQLEQYDWELEVVINNTYQDEVDECQVYTLEEAPDAVEYDWKIYLN